MPQSAAQEFTLKQETTLEKLAPHKPYQGRKINQRPAPGSGGKPPPAKQPRPF